MRRWIMVLCLSLCVPVVAQATTRVTIEAATFTNGFMNVFNLPAPDGDGAFQFGQPWGVPDLTVTFNGDELSFGPAGIDTDDAFWYVSGGGPGGVGNKIMEAGCYLQNDGGLAGERVIFRFEVLSNTLIDGYTARAFIRDFAPDFSSNVSSVIDVDTPGAYALELQAIDDAARHVQVGVQLVGPNVWPTDVAAAGTIVFGPRDTVPNEASSFGSIKALYGN